MFARSGAKEIDLLFHGTRIDKAGNSALMAQLQKLISWKSKLSVQKDFSSYEIGWVVECAL